MAEPDLSLARAPGLVASPPEWIHAVNEDFATFLNDHASCEKKASGMALNVAAHYPDRPRLVEAMVDLAVEELTHYREVMRLLLARDIVPGPDLKDRYIAALNKEIRRGPQHFLLDRLLVGAVVERRGAERFAIVAERGVDQSLARFYAAIAASEDRHWLLFVNLALTHCAPDDVWARFIELTDIEARVMLAQPLRAALH